MANNPNNHVMNTIFHNKSRDPNPSGGLRSPDPKFTKDTRYDFSGNSRERQNR